MPIPGINYGHQYSSLNYSAVSVERDLAWLWQCGLRTLRVAYPPFDQPTAIVRSKDIVVRALARGFKVYWGVGAGGTTLNTARWADFKVYVKAHFLPWAASLQNSLFIASLGNEEDFHNDGTTLSKATVRYDVAHDLATEAQLVLAYSQCSYETDAGQCNIWAVDGLGDLDLIGFNLYYEWFPAGTFKQAIAQMTGHFNDKVYVSEWSTDGGYDAATIFGATAEHQWAANIKARQEILEAASIEHCFFTYQDGSFGLPTDTWSLRKANGDYRLAWFLLTGMRQRHSRQVASRTYGEVRTIHTRQRALIE